VRARRLRLLDLASPPSAGRPRHLSAASGLVAAGDRLYVIADDELHLGCFELDGARPGTLERLLPGELPARRAARKARKPDFEVLARMPSGTLLALGSGSTEARSTGVAVGLDATGAIAAEPRPVDFSQLRAALAARFSSPNIEGGCIVGDELVLLQRANARDRVNALIGVPVDAFEAAITSGRFDSPGTAIRSVEVALQDDGVPLSFTDCAVLPDGRIVFTAVAENTRDSYHDGPCRAAAVGLMDRTGRVLRLSPLEPTRKIEGVHAWLEGGAIRLLLVTDADDAEIPAELLAAELA
jgi:hypothetical protein